LGRIGGKKTNRRNGDERIYDMTKKHNECVNILELSDLNIDEIRKGGM